MSGISTAILDAAERHIRIGGFNSFSFRDIAADVGVKSSSVHYHFPTKEKLAAAVIHRYTMEVAKIIDQELETDPDPVRVWIRAFRGTLRSTERMCPSVVLGAGSLDLPKEVASEVKQFFKMCLNKLLASGVTVDEANRLMATITGAMVIANALNDVGAYDRATNEYIVGKRVSATSRKTSRRAK